MRSFISFLSQLWVLRQGTFYSLAAHSLIRNSRYFPKTRLTVTRHDAHPENFHEMRYSYVSAPMEALGPPGAQAYGQQKSLEDIKLIQSEASPNIYTDREPLKARTPLSSFKGSENLILRKVNSIS